ncbi:prepilin-type N-terminal cleavage/methylation domain-containing protein [Vibrio sp. SCSIO 43140]|uniref:type IV pilus modification PilV family protein n=1 Tax=Vibrio sp. SCSIO 43140 TaxID=2819100 RepID=UPI002076007D|nr:prepilin-type N-terminal cleavage/methylation domain-containing protein [Vibrio sp. SCSIO 43140]USD61051.1 prepilin-type N-terminal cleavage/methylation domain-containing protein [Vibrio sp. SCSIO 43140]
MTSNQRGFSLIEVMIAMCLVGVGALGLVKMQTFIEQRSDYAYSSIQALGLAEARLEWFRTRGANSADSSMVVADFDADIIDGSELRAPYFLTWTVPAVTMDGNVKTVVVNVSWSDRLGQSQNLSLTTQISRFSEFD